MNLWKGIAPYFDDMFHLRVNERAVNGFFVLFIALLPFVNKASKAAALLYLLLFFRMIYRERDFLLPKLHKIFLGGLFGTIFIGDILNGIDLENIKRALYLMIFISLYYATVYFVQKKILTLKVLVMVVLISMTLYMIDGYLQFFFGYDYILQKLPTGGGMSGISRNRNIFALALLFYIAVLSYLTLEHQKRYGILLLVALMAVMMTLSRQMWIATGVFFFIVILFQHRTLSLRFWITGAIAILLIGWVLWQLPEMHERFLQLENGNSSGRTELWYHLLAHVPEHLWFGHGLHAPLNAIGTKIEYVYAHNLTIGVLLLFLSFWHMLRHCVILAPHMLL